MTKGRRQLRALRTWRLTVGVPATGTAAQRNHKVGVQAERVKESREVHRLREVDDDVVVLMRGSTADESLCFPGLNLQSFTRNHCSSITSVSPRPRM